MGVEEGGGGCRAGALENVVLGKHITHPFLITHPPSINTIQQNHMFQKYCSISYVLDLFSHLQKYYFLLFLQL